MDNHDNKMLERIEKKEEDIYLTILNRGTKGLFLIAAATAIALSPYIAGKIYSAVKSFNLNEKKDWKPVVVKEGQNLEGFLRGEGVLSDKPNLISRLFQKGFKDEMYHTIWSNNPGETYSTSKIGTDWAIEVGDTLYLPDLNKDGKVSWQKVKK